MPEEEKDTEQVEAQNVELEEMEESIAEGQEPNLDLLLDINMPLSVVIGKTEVKFRDLLQLGPGAVLPLDKAVGQPAEIYIQDIKFATGDIVVVDGCYAVRLKEIVGMEAAQKAAAQAQ